MRKPIRNAETHEYVRTTLFIAPFTVLIPPNNQYNLAQMLVPIDDVNTMFYWIAWHPDPTKGISAGGVAQVLRRRQSASIWIATYRKKRNLANDYLQDREAMKRGDFTGIKGIPTQDMAMWESMGPIADRSRGPLRLERPRGGAVPPHDGRGGEEVPGERARDRRAEKRAHVDLASFEGVVSKAVDWRTLGLHHHPEETA